MYELEKVTTLSRITELKNQSVFTWEGMSTEESNLQAIDEGLREHGFDKDAVMHMTVISGKLMNEYSHLTGRNAYRDDLSILSVLDYYNPAVKIALGARWLDDIIDNNEYREEPADSYD